MTNAPSRHVVPMSIDFGQLAAWGGLVAASVIALFPIYLVVLTAFKLPIDITRGNFGLFFDPTLDNFRQLLGLQPSDFQVDLLLHFENTIFAAFGSTFLAIVIGTPAAYAFARIRFPGSMLGLSSLLIFRLLPPIATVIPFYLIMRTVGLLDSVFALILAYTTFNLPFFVWTMFNFFKDLPRELEEAAWIDGATRWQTFVKVMLPLSIPGLAASSIFCLILAWNDFLFALILTSREAQTLPLLVAGFVTDMGVSWGLIMAAGTVIVLPVLIFALFTQKYLLRGVAGGAVKG